MTTVSVRVDENTKKQAETLLENLGMNLSCAVNVFLKALVREQGFPFDVKVEASEKSSQKISEEDLFLAIAKANVLSHEKAYKELAE